MRHIADNFIHLFAMLNFENIKMQKLLYGFVLVSILLLNSPAVSAGWDDDDDDIEDFLRNFNDDDFDDLL